VGELKIAAAKLQHHVIYVSDLKRSKDFYMKLFDLQFSAAKAAGERWEEHRKRLS